MAKGVINEFVDPSSYAQIEKLISLLEKSKSELSANIGEAIKFNAAIGGAKSMKDFNVETEKAAAAMMKIQKSIEAERLAEVRLQQAREKAFDKFEAQLKKQEALQVRQAKQAQNNVEKQIKLEATAEKNRERTAAKLATDSAKHSRIITEQSRVYNQLSVVLEKNRKDAKDIGIIYGLNSEQFKKASKSVIELDAKLKAVDATLGQHQRNVGNYKSGFNGLGNSINQLTREFPAFTFSVQTGFLALSNNLPIFFDEIKRTQDGIKAMRAEGQQVPGLLKQLATSFLSLGTVLSIGVTLLTVYGKEIGDFFGSMFQGTKALTAFADRQKSLNDIYKESNQEAGKQISTLKLLYQATQDTTLSLAERTKAAKELQKTFPEQFKNAKLSAILSGDEAKAFNETTAAIIRQARAKAAKGKIDDIESKLLDSEFQKQKIRNATANQANRIKGDISSGGNSSSLTGYNAAITVTESQRKAIVRSKGALEIEQIDKNNKILENERNFLIKYVGLDELVDEIVDGGKKDKKTPKEDTTQRDNLERIQANIQAEVDAAREIAENEENSYDLRLDALKVFTEKSKDLALVGQKIELLEKELTKPKILAIEDDKNRAIIASNQEAAKINQDIIEDGLNAEQKARARAAQKIINDITNDETLRLTLLNNAFANGTISEEQYGELKVKIQREYARKLISQEIQTVTDLLALANLSVDDRAAAEKRLADLKLKYAEIAAEGQKDANDKLTRSELENIRKREEAEKKLIDIRKDFQNEIAELTSTIVNAQFTRQSEELALQSDLIDKRSEKETEAVNRSLDTEEQKKAKLAMIEARAAVQKETIAKRQQEIDVKRAKFEKAAAITRILIDTASAEVAALRYLSNPFTAPLYPAIAALIAGVGLAQSAAVLATPIPKYAVGTNYSPEGAAWVGEQGTELRIDPSGRYSLTPDKPTLTYLEKGTKIVSNPELKRIMAKPEKIQHVGGQAIDISRLIQAQDNSASRIEKAIGHIKPGRSQIITEGGMKYIHTKGSKWTRYINRNFN